MIINLKARIVKPYYSVNHNIKKILHKVFTVDVPTCTMKKLRQDRVELEHGSNLLIELGIWLLNNHFLDIELKDADSMIKVFIDVFVCFPL